MENSNSKQKDAKCKQCVNLGRGRPVLRKASRYSMYQDINLSSVPSVGQRIGSSYSTTDWTDLADSLVVEIDQKVSVGLGGIPPWAFRHRSLLKTRLGCSPMPQLPVLPCRTFQAPRKQNSCRWQYKKAPLEPQRYPSPGERLPSSGFLFYHGLDG